MLAKLKTLPLLNDWRCPSFLERVLFGITCLGFCTDITSRDKCHRYCWEQVRTPAKLVQLSRKNDTHLLEQ